MKKKYGVFFGFAVLLIAALFTLAGCGDKDSGDPTSPSKNDPPIEISTLAELNAISTDAGNLSKNYKLMADITGPVTRPIGIASGTDFVGFTGEFDGNGHTITVDIRDGLVVSEGELAGIYGGLFAGIVNRGLVHDLTVTGTVNITTSGSLNIYAGGVVAGMLQGGTVRKVTSAVNVTASNSGGSLYVVAGGIAGGARGATVSDSYTTGAISAAATGTNTGHLNVEAGGVGGAFLSGTVSHVYATGNVSAVATGTYSDGHAQAGGVAGVINTTSVLNAYATGNVSASASSKVDARAGGAVGHFNDRGSVRYVYATGNVSVTANGSGGRGCAGGVVGNLKDEGSVSNTVALNTSVSITGSSSNQQVHRVIGSIEDNGTRKDNYGKEDLTPTVTNGSYTPVKGADKADGEDVAVTGGPPPSAYTAPDKDWWREKGFKGADWNTVWQWDSTTGLPKLR
ncbi:MAG: hypothetical protein LBP76_00645 [Treponema sp.]|jgi:hypothetical protein|nr:hypothetical protein [Treponema sp.]